MNSPVLSLCFSDFLKKWTLDISLSLVSAHLHPFFEEYETAHLKLNALLHAFDSNPEYKIAFVNWVISQRGEDAQIINFDGSIRMVGLKTSITFLTTCLLGDRIPVKALQRDPKSTFFLKPLDQTLAFAHLCQQFFKDGTRYHDVAFPMGLVFDFVSFQNELQNNPENKKKIDGFIKNRFELALNSSTVAIELVKSRQRMVREKDMLPLIFMEAGAQAAFALFNPIYVDFVTQAEKINLSPSLIDYAERTRFGAHHSWLGNALTPALPQFSKLGQVLLNLQTPYRYSEPSETDTSDLASIVFLSIYLARNQTLLSKNTNETTASNLCRELNYLEQGVDYKKVFRKAS